MKNFTNLIFSTLISTALLVLFSCGGTTVVPPNPHTETPVTPSNLSAEYKVANEISITWTDNSDNEDGFVIEKSESEQGSFSQIATPSENINSFSDTSFEIGKTYFYRVRAFNSIGNSEFSNVDSVTTSLISPSALIASFGTPVSIKLTWNYPISMADGFKFERSANSSDFVEIFPEIPDPSILRAIDHDIENNRIYTYRIIAYKGANNSDPSALATINTALEAPKSFSAVFSTNKIDLAWSAGSENTSDYLIERKIEGDSSFTPLVTLNDRAILTYTDNSIQADKIHQYRISSKNDLGSSDLKETSVDTMTIPLAPQNLRATIPLGEVKLEWSDMATNESEYIIEKSSDGINFPEGISRPANTTSFIDMPGSATDYYYRVKAKNRTGSSSYANITVNYSQIPSSPDNFIASYLEQSQTMYLTWIAIGSGVSDTPINITGFKLDKDTTCSDNWGIISENIAPSSVFYLDPISPEPSQPVCYRLRAFNSFGDSIPVYAGSNAQINPPSNLAVRLVCSSPTTIGNSSTATYKIALTWTDNSNNEDGFEIFRSDDGGDYRLVKTVAAQADDAEDNFNSEFGLKTNTSYRYKVRAKNALGFSNYSNEASVTTTFTWSTFGAEQEFNRENMTGGDLTLTWHEPPFSCETNWQLERYLNSTTGTPNVRTSTTHAAASSRHVVFTENSSTGMEYEKNYFYRVRAIIKIGDILVGYSNWSDFAEFNTTREPEDPTNLSAIQYGPPVNGILATWTDNSTREEKFIIERCEWVDGYLNNDYCRSGTTFTYEVGSNVTQYLDQSALAVGRTYRYRVKSWNSFTDTDETTMSSAVYVRIQ